jgi:hypothetical protein
MDTQTLEKKNERRRYTLPGFVILVVSPGYSSWGYAGGETTGLNSAHHLYAPVFHISLFLHYLLFFLIKKSNPPERIIRSGAIRFGRAKNQGKSNFVCHLPLERKRGAKSSSRF